MEYLFLGFLQGLTEFLPISSSGHLYLAETYLGLKPDLNLTILLHVGSMLAVVVFFRKEIFRIFKNTFFPTKSNNDLLGWKLIVATICTVPVALMIKPFFDDFLSIETVAITLMITACFIFVAEKYRSQKNILTWNTAILLGLFQGIAVIPGISRSGLTIAILILLGLRRKLSAEISFLLSIPTIIGALIFAQSDLGGGLSFSVNNLIGFGASFLASLFAIQWMLKLVEGKWIWFSAYCLILGGGLLVLPYFLIK